MRIHLISTTAGQLLIPSPYIYTHALTYTDTQKYMHIHPHVYPRTHTYMYARNYSIVIRLYDAAKDVFLCCRSSGDKTSTQGLIAFTRDVPTLFLYPFFLTLCPIHVLQICENDSPKLLEFTSELPHLEGASRYESSCLDYSGFTFGTPT